MPQKTIDRIQNTNNGTMGMTFQLGCSDQSQRLKRQADFACSPTKVIGTMPWMIQGDAGNGGCNFNANPIGP